LIYRYLPIFYRIFQKILYQDALSSGPEMMDQFCTAQYDEEHVQAPEEYGPPGRKVEISEDQPEQQNRCTAQIDANGPEKSQPGGSIVG
jgi:hypothetical protein